ncbi:MAG: 2-C-methyl-D-erythritol 2,4-cyclodiphosphate synthase [Chloroflexi bacterium]|nr:2-C-methyl-D-erythritol 2,4-cyclodiphosphate synthase [Chloroflexota bacterium]
MKLRVGIGIDFHRFQEGRPLVLGGMVVPHEDGLGGHSDADVLLHAVMDALLGAAGLPDIGVQFPNSDVRYLDVSSLALLGRVKDLVSAGGWHIGNIDATIIAERPHLASYIPAMKQVIAQALGLAPEEVGVKATTAEGVGVLGRGEGMAAWAVVLLQKGVPKSENL